MKRNFILIVLVEMCMLAKAQINQLVWDDSRLMYATPIEAIDSLTYGEIEEHDTLHLLLPQTFTIVKQDTVYLYDTIYVKVPSTGTPDGIHEYVDLGLSVKWATCNVGATNPEDYGDYFAWGEVEPKETYDWSTYVYCVDSTNNLTKYCSQSDSGKDGFTDVKIILEREDDAATVNWGNTWRIPTHEEFLELKENCTWKWVHQNGVNGYEVTGTNGNSIFLPAGGYFIDEENRRVRTHGYYWANGLDTDGSSRAYSFYFFSNAMDYFDWNTSSRCEGHSIRPVHRQTIPAFKK
jgi:hypothetical protein